MRMSSLISPTAVRPVKRVPIGVACERATLVVHPLSAGAREHDLRKLLRA